MRFSKSPDAIQAHRILRSILSGRCNCGPRKVNKPLALYGAGDLGRMAKEYFDRLGIPIILVVDQASAAQQSNSFWARVPVIHPNEVQESFKSTVLLAICVVKAEFSQIHATLSEQGWNDVVPFYDVAEAYRDVHPLGNGWFASDSDLEDVANIDYVLSVWGDDISRAHHLQFIAWRYLRQDWVFEDAEVNGGDRFFIPEVKSLLNDHETFCDLGAHHAEVILKFLAAVNSKFSRVHAIEADPENSNRLSANLSHLDDALRRRIEIINSAVAQHPSTQKFYSGLGYASQLSDLGTCQMEVQTIDELDLKPSFLKLHLEGGELNALKGGRRTLHTTRPIIVATCYHNSEGIWEISKWLSDELEDYRLHFRLHGWCGTGAVVYGIPVERI